MNPYLIVPIILFIVIAYFSVSRSKFRQKQNAIIAKIKIEYQDEPIYICDGFDNLGDNLYQFYGEVCSKDIKPGMSIILPGLGEHKIFEVYANDNTPDKPNEILAKNETGAIVIEAKKLDTKTLDEKLKQDLVLILRIS